MTKYLPEKMMFLLITYTLSTAFYVITESDAAQDLLQVRVEATY